MEDKKSDSSYTHILKYTGIFGGVQSIGILVGIIRNKLCAVILGPEGFGLISLFNSTVTFVSNATNLGVSFSAVRNISEIFDSNDSVKQAHCIKVVRLWSLLTALLGMFMCIALSPLLNKWTFDWGDHTLHFVLLSPVVAMTAITGGEMAILKGARQLKKLAMISIYTVVASLFISIPIYYIWGEAGIVPSLVIMALATMLVTNFYSYHQYPLKPLFEKGLIDEGLGMVKLGISFLLAGILGSGAELVVRSYLNNYSSMETLGLYNAGFVIVFTYASMVFTAMETDYFPRLSSINDDVKLLNEIVNKQTEVSLLLISPMLVVFTIILPLLMPLLYSGKFLPVVGMAQVSVFSMFFRSFTLPVAYINLAKGNSSAYLVLEASYDVVFVVLIICCFSLFGLWGTGLALTLASIFDFLIVNVFARFKYHFSIHRHVIRAILLQLPILLASYLLTFVGIEWMYWMLESVLALVSIMISMYILYRKESLWNSLCKKIKSKFDV